MAANMLANSSKILDNISIALAVINKYDKAAMLQISTLLWPVYYIACPWVLWNGTSYTFI